MANYISHAIISDKIYDKLKKNKCFNVNIKKEKLKMFSLGQDFMVFKRSCFLHTHYYDSKRFFIETINYIYDNNLQYDEDVMTYLYGHIAHYALDITIHPFIGELIRGVKSKSIIPPHTVIECEIDKYLIKKHCNNKFNVSYLKLKTINNDNINKVINHTYRKVYGFIDVNYIYKSTTLFIKACNNPLTYLYKNKFNLFNILTNKDKYCDNIDFYNFVNNISKRSNTIDNIINASIQKTIDMIKYTNNYLYNNEDISILNYAFDDTAYDVGVMKEDNYGYNSLPAYSLEIDV